MTPVLVLVAVVLTAYAWNQFAPGRLQSVWSQRIRPKVQRPALPLQSAKALFPEPASALPDRGASVTTTDFVGLWQLAYTRVNAWSRSTRAWLIVGTLALGWYAWAQFLRQDYDWSVVLIWLGGVGGFLALVAEPQSWRLSIPRSEWILFGLVMVVGVALRLYRVDSVPFGLNHDAAYSGLVAVKNAHSSAYMPWSPDNNAGETFFDYWITGLIALLGPTPLAIKGAAATAGILTLPMMYLFTRRLLGVRAAVIATALLTVSGWHLIFSRVGWRVVTLPLVEVSALYFLFRAFETRRRGSFAIAGALLALQLNTYLAGRIVLLIAGLWALVELWRGPSRLALLRGYALALVAFLFAGASILAFAITNPDAFNGRYNAVSIIPQLLAGNWAPLWQNIQTSIGLFTVHANGNDFFVDQPLLDPPTSWLFVLGLVVAMWWAIRRSYRYAFVLFGLVMALLPGIAAMPNGNRGMGTLPFVYILAALPLVALLNVAGSLRGWLPRNARLLPEAIVTLVLFFALLGAFNQYLGPKRAEVWGVYPETTVVGQYIRQIDARYDSYLTDNYPRDALTYITYQPGDPLVGLDQGGYPLQPHYTWQDSNQQFLADTARPGRGLAFFMFSGLPQNDAMLQQLRARYHNAVAFTLIYHDDIVDRPASLVVLVPPPGTVAKADVPATAGPAI